MTADTVWDVEPPANIAAEQAVIGAVLLQPRLLDDLSLEPADFYRPGHQTIWSVILDLHEHGKPVDPISVKDALGIELAKVGGGGYLVTLVENANVGAAPYHAALVAQKAAQRRILTAARSVVAAAEAGIDDLADYATTTMDTATRASRAGGAVRVGDLFDAAVDDLDSSVKVTGLPTGYLDLDLFLNPLDAGQLIVVASRPSVGKSVLAVDWCRQISIRLRETSVLVSMEMSEAEIMRRMISAESRTALTSLAAHNLSEDDWERIRRARARIIDAPLFVDDTPVQTLASLRALVRRHRPRVLVVDYLQLLTSPNRPESRQQEVADLTRGLKLLAKAEGIAVVLLAQLNRGPEQRSDKRPWLSDLRESGAIEQDADTVILLHRPEVYDPDNQDVAGKVELIVSKQRNGRTGVAHLAAQLSIARFVDAARTLS